MTQIKIEVPSNDLIALSALGEALQRIAAERGYERSLRVEGHVESFTKTVKVGEESITETTTRTVDAPTREDVERTATKLESNATCGAHTDPYANVELKDETKKGVTSYNDIARTVNASFDDIDTSQNIMGEDVDDTTQQYEAGGGVEDDTLDKDGLPWDKRIHSRGKTRLADDTWRLARKPNDKTQEEWDEYVASVKAELKAVQDIPAPSDTVTPQATATVQLNEGVTTEQIVEALVTPPVVETVIPPTLDEQAVADVQASEPVAAVEPPASVTTDHTPSVSTFQELMKYITSDAAKRGATNDMIKEVLAQVDPSLTAIPLIANRADLIPAFVAKLEAKLS